MSQREPIQPHSVADSPTRQDQADVLRGYRDGFQAVHVITTGVQTGLFEWLAAHPQGITYQELAQETGYHAPYLRIWCSTAYRFYLWLSNVGFKSVDHHLITGMPQGTVYLDIARKR